MITLAVPASVAAGASSLVFPRRGREKVQVTGTFVATVAIEVSSDGVRWLEIARTSAPTLITLRRRRWRRVRANTVAYTSGAPAAVLTQ